MQPITARGLGKTFEFQQLELLLHQQRRFHDAVKVFQQRIELHPPCLLELLKELERIAIRQRDHHFQLPFLLRVQQPVISKRIHVGQQEIAGKQAVQIAA